MIRPRLPLLAMLAMLAVAAIPAACALAIPVRMEPTTTTPLPVTAKTPAGSTRTVSDAADIPAALQDAAGGILGLLGHALGGPWGDLAGIVVTTVLAGAAGHSVGHRRGKKSAAKAPAIVTA